MKARDGQKMRKARPPEQIVGITVHIAPVTDKQRGRYAAGGCRHSGCDLVCPRLSEPAEPLSQCSMGFHLDMVHGNHIAACHHIANARLNAVVPRAVHHWRLDCRRCLRKLPPCRCKPCADPGQKHDGQVPPSSLQ